MTEQQSSLRSVRVIALITLLKHISSGKIGAAAWDVAIFLVNRHPWNPACGHRFNDFDGLVGIAAVYWGAALLFILLAVRWSIPWNERVEKRWEA